MNINAIYIFLLDAYKKGPLSWWVYGVPLSNSVVGVKFCQRREIRAEGIYKQLTKREGEEQRATGGRVIVVVVVALAVSVRSLLLYSEKMVDQCGLGWILASVLGAAALYFLFGKKNCGVSNERRRESLKNIATTNGECKSSNSDGDIIIVGAGVAGSALAYTLAKVILSFWFLFSIVILKHSALSSKFCVLNGWRFLILSLEKC